MRERMTSGAVARAGGPGPRMGGTRLKRVRAPAALVSLPPVRRAVREMKPYVPGKPIEDVQRELGLVDVVKLASNESPIGPSPRAVRAAAEALAKSHLYPEPTSRALREALARRWGTRPEGVLVGNGSDEVFRLLAETYLEPGDAVVAPTPSFSVYKMVAQLAGARCVEVPLTGFDHDLPAMAHAAQEARLVFVCSPNNPTGTAFSASAFEDFMGRVPGSCIVVLDEAYAEFNDDPAFDARAWLGRWRNLVVSRTFSKAYGLAGLRLGYAFADPDLLAPLFTTRDPFGVNRAAQEAGLAALDDEEHLRRTRDVVREGRRVLTEGFGALGLDAVPSRANFILVHVGPDAKAVAERLLRVGFVVRYTASFGLPEHFRVSVGTEDQNRRFLDALKAALGG